MQMLDIRAGSYLFKARIETELTPDTCAKFLDLLPFKNKVIHSRWSGEAVWIPLGDFETGLRQCQGKPA